MEKTYRVEFNTTGFYEGAGIWDTLDELCEIEASDAQEAIELAKEWWIEDSDNPEKTEDEITKYAWRAAENKYDEDGYPEPYEWEFED